MGSDEVITKMKKQLSEKEDFIDYLVKSKSESF